MESIDYFDKSSKQSIDVVVYFGQILPQRFKFTRNEILQSFNGFHPLVLKNVFVFSFKVKDRVSPPPDTRRTRATTEGPPTLWAFPSPSRSTSIPAVCRAAPSRKCRKSGRRCGCAATTTPPRPPHPKRAADAPRCAALHGTTISVGTLTSPRRSSPQLDPLSTIDSHRRMATKTSSSRWIKWDRGSVWPTNSPGHRRPPGRSSAPEEVPSFFQFFFKNFSQKFFSKLITLIRCSKIKVMLMRWRRWRQKEYPVGTWDIDLFNIDVLNLGQ